MGCDTVSEYLLDEGSWGMRGEGSGVNVGTKSFRFGDWGHP